MNSHKSLRNAREFIRKQGGKIAPLMVSEEELNPETQDDLSLGAYALEPTTTCYEIDYNYPDDSDCSEFSFFEDGRQRTNHIGYIPAKYGSHQALIPVHFFVVAAVILKRENKKLNVWAEPAIKQGILVEKSLVPKPYLLDEIEALGLEVIDTKDP